jgi:hypothetical protein
MEKTKKITFIVFPLLFIVMVVAFGFLINERVNKDTLSKELQENLSLILENSKVLPGKMSTSIGLNISVKLDGLKVLDATTGQTYINLKKFEISTPWSSLFWSGVPVRFRIEGLEINYNDKFKSVISAEKLQERAAYRNILGFSTFHKDSKFDFDLKTIVFNGMKQSLNIDEMKIKNFKWDTYTAYEVSGQISKKIIGKTFSAGLRTVGELNLKETASYGKLNTKSVLTITNLSIDEKNLDIEDLNGSLLLTTDEMQLLKGKVSFMGDNYFNSEITFKERGQVDLKSLDANLNLETLIKMGLIEELPEQIKKSSLALKGDITFKDKRVEAVDLKFNTVSPIEINIGEMNFFSNFNGYWDVDRAGIEMKGRFSEGQLLTKIEFSKADSIGRLSQFKPRLIDVKLFNVDLRSMALKKKTFFPALKELLKDKSWSKTIENINLEVEKCSFGSELLNAKASFQKNLENYVSEDFQMTFGKEGKLDGQFKVSEKRISGSLGFEKFNIMAVSSFLPNAESGLSGIYQGAIVGSYNFPPVKTRSIAVNMEVFDADLSKFKVVDRIAEFVSKIAPESMKATRKSRINYIKLRSNIGDSTVLIDELILREEKNDYQLSANGRISILKEKDVFPYQGSEVFVEVNNLSGDLWDKTKLPAIIPIRIRANDEEWLPDLMYTIDALRLKK